MKKKPALRFKVNPVEILIFSGMLVIFLNSLYQLLYVKIPSPKESALIPLAASPLHEAGPANKQRQIASIMNGLDFFNLNCEPRIGKNTLGSKIRLIGKICGYDPKQEALRPRTIVKIKNDTQAENATVFSQYSEGTFQTEYIPLKNRESVIQVRFVYPDQREISQEVTVTRREIPLQPESSTRPGEPESPEE